MMGDTGEQTTHQGHAIGFPDYDLPEALSCDRKGLLACT